MSNGNGKRSFLMPMDIPTVSLIATESQSVVRERTFDNEMDIAYLIGLLRNQRVTGTLRIDISQGGINSIRLEERQKLAP